MALHVQNMKNSTIKSILEKEKLSGPNFLDGYRNLWIVLTAERKLVYLETPLPEAPTPMAFVEIVAEYTRWLDTQKKVACLMLTSMTPELQKNLEDFNTCDMLQELKTMFQQQADQELFETVNAGMVLTYRLA